MKSFSGKHVLKGIDLSVNAEESLTLIGTSGCGKSITLKCLLGLITADGGSIKVDGTEFGTNCTTLRRCATALA